MLLTLCIVGTYMDRDGYAYPSQETIAKGARTTARTIQRHIAAAKREGWIATELAGRGGKGWRFTCYRACIPDYIDIDEQEEYLADAIASQVGDIQRDDIIVSSRMGNGHDTIVSPRCPPEPVRDDNGHAKMTTNGADGDDNPSISCRHNSVVLTPASRTPAPRTPAPEEAHVPVRTLKDRKPEEAAIETPSTPPTLSARRFGVRGSAQKPRTITRRDIERLEAAGFGGTEEMAKHLRVTVEELEQARFRSAV